jgi:hypothetical protein
LATSLLPAVSNSLRNPFARFFRTTSIFVLILALLLPSTAPAWSLVTPLSGSGALSAPAAQCADILGIRQDAEQLAAWRKSGANNPELNELRAHTLRRILQGTVQVQIAENRLQTEQAYTYDVLDRETRKINTVNQLFTIANFLQFGVLYTIEPFSRIQKLFIQSAICTTVGGGIGLALPLANIWYNKHAKAKNLAPPTYMGHLVNGKPVDGSGMPTFVAGYLDSVEPGSNVTRREALNEIWKQRYHADMNKKETLCGLDDGKPKSIFVLNSRIVLLWSLYTTIQGFDRELLTLLDEVSGYKSGQRLLGDTKTLPAAVLGGQADEAVRLLNLESVVAELKSLNNDPNPSDRKTELQIILMEKILAAYLDMRIGADRCQEELNYQIDVVLAQMNARKGKFLQKTFEANFLQTNTLGTNAGYQYLRGNARAGNELFAIANSTGILITTVSLIATHGGWRKNESAPNSLADLFDLRANEKHGFSPLVWNFLNSPGPDTKGKTRREYLQEKWKNEAVSTIDITQKRNQEKLGSMPSCKWDTIKLVSNRVALLSALQEQMGQFDVCLLELLRKAWPETRMASQAGTINDSYAAAAAKVLGVQNLTSDSKLDARSRLLLARHVLEGFLEAANDADLIGQEIIVENQVMSRMIRHRDMVI